MGCTLVKASCRLALAPGHPSCHCTTLHLHFHLNPLPSLAVLVLAAAAVAAAVHIFAALTAEQWQYP